jgi:ATP-dependent DNA helicase RecG
MRNYEIIEELLDAPEGEHYEFKEAKTRFDSGEAARYCCALSNWGGGKFVLGISDKRPRKIVGSQAFNQPERTRKGLMDKLRVRVDFDVLKTQDGKRVLVFDIAARPLGLPVQVEGIAWWRDGDSLVPMPEDVRRKIYAETGHDFSSDICAGATIADISIETIEVFRSKWIAKIKTDPEKAGLLKRISGIQPEQLLRDIGAVTDDGITCAALILFGTPTALTKHLAQAEVIFEYRPSNRPGAAAAREEFRAGFFSFFDKLWELVNLRNDKLHYQDGFFVFDIPAYNERVVREAILNAVSHRNYQLPGSVFVKQFHDRLEIDSPGGFPHGITRDNIVFRQAPHNRLIAEILSRCGLVERAGQGMDLIYELCIREAKALPDFLDSDEYVVRMRLAGNKLDEKLLAIFKKIGESVSGSLSTEELMIINSLYRGKKVGAELREFLPGLLELGIVEQRKGKYTLRKDLADIKRNGSLSGSINDPINATNSGNNVTAKTGIDPVSDPDDPVSDPENDSCDPVIDLAKDPVTAVLKTISRNNRVTYEQIADALGVSRATVRRHIKTLRESGKLERIGSDKAGYWKVSEEE